MPLMQKHILSGKRLHWSHVFGGWIVHILGYLWHLGEGLAAKPLTLAIPLLYRLSLLPFIGW